MFYYAGSSSNLERIFAQKGFSETGLEPLQIENYRNAVFVVKGEVDTVYLSDGTAFPFEKNEKITEKFAPSQQHPTQSFDAHQSQFVVNGLLDELTGRDCSGLSLSFRILKILSSGKMIGSFILYGNQREKKILETILKGIDVKELSRVPTDFYWRIVEFLFLNRPN